MHWTDLSLNILYSVIGVLAVGLVAFLLAWLFWKLLRVRSERNHQVILENQGNCRSMYYLEVKSPEPALEFSLFYNNLPLAPVYLPVEEEAEEVEVNAAPAQEGKKGAVAAASTGASAGSQALQSASGKVGRASSLMEQLGAILPGKWGTKLKEASATTRGVQVKAMRTARMPERVKRQVTGFRELKNGKKGAASKTGGTFVTSSPGSGGRIVETTKEAYFVQTPEVEAGQSLKLTLKIGSKQRKLSRGSYAYSFEALQKAVDFPDVESKSFIQNGIVNFKPVAAWRYFLRYFTTIVVVLGAAVALVFLYRYLWL